MSRLYMKSTVREFETNCELTPASPVKKIGIVDNSISISNLLREYLASERLLLDDMPSTFRSHTG